MSSTNRAPPNRRGSTSLPEASEIALLQLLSSETKLSPAFKVRADANKGLFGDGSGGASKPQKELRTAVTKRREYLLKTPLALKASLERRGLPYPNFLSGLPPTSPLVASPTVQSPPVQSPPLRPFRLSSFSPQHQQEREMTVHSRQYTLDLEDPWNNPENILVILGERSKKNDEEIVSRIDLCVPILDLRDYIAGRYSGAISECGGKIILVKPSLAMYQWKKASTMQDAEVGQDAKIVEQHKVICSAVNKNPDLVKEELVLKLPDNLTVSNEVFNESVSGLDLEGRLRRRGVNFTDKGGTLVPLTFYYVWYSVIIDGTTTTIDNKKRGNKQDDDLANLLQGALIFEGDDDELADDDNLADGNDDEPMADEVEDGGDDHLADGNDHNDEPVQEEVEDGGDDHLAVDNGDEPAEDEVEDGDEEFAEDPAPEFGQDPSAAPAPAPSAASLVDAEEAARQQTLVRAAAREKNARERERDAAAIQAGEDVQAAAEMPVARYPPMALSQLTGITGTRGVGLAIVQKPPESHSRSSQAIVAYINDVEASMNRDIVDGNELLSEMASSMDTANSKRERLSDESNQGPSIRRDEDSKPPAKKNYNTRGRSSEATRKVYETRGRSRGRSPW